MKALPISSFVLFSLLAVPVHAGTDTPPSPALESLLGSEQLKIEGTPILAGDILLDLYSENGYRMIWKRPSAEEALRLIGTADDHGLDPEDYNASLLMEVIARWLQEPSEETRARFDILLSESLLRYAYHRRYGKVKAGDLDTNINFRRDTFNGRSVAANVREALAADSPGSFIDSAAPPGPYYRQMQRALADLRSIRDRGGWPELKPGPALREGDSDERVALLRKRLADSGDLTDRAGGAPHYFDPGLGEAVRRFQARHGLDPDGIVGRQSIRAMNVSVDDRIDQVRISLERLRWVQQERVETMVVVNIAQFLAAFFKDGELAWNTRAMVGKHYRQTPVFRGDIAYMEFNPTWTIPPGILRNDTLPAIKRDPRYLASKKIEVLDRQGRVVDPATVDWSRYSRSIPYTLRQTPGPHNALGTVKFIFPNEHFVFLHDTPNRELFDRSQRAFSSGCIRVEDPLRLAELLLDDPDRYDRSTLQAVVDSRKTQRINLKPKIPVVIVYLTAGLGPEGEITFMEDIYDRDRAVLDALNGPVSIQLPRGHGG